MKAQELRIGNYVEYNKHILTVDSITPDVIVCELNKHLEGISDGEFTPIPLNEEWLLKFGFDDLGGNYMGYYEFKKGTFSIIREQDDYCFPYESYNGDNIDLDLKYIHQLQNLYFALTQTELELKIK